MKTKELIKRIEEIFIEKLKSKTGWGRNEILMCYKDAVNDALLEASENFIKDEQSLINKHIYKLKRKV